MRAVVQKVKFSEVIVSGETVGKIGMGLNVLLGVENKDTEEDARYLAEKIVNLRVFEDSNEKMNLSLLDVNGQMLVISQFTLLGDCRKGRRPNFMAAAKPEEASKLYESFISCCKSFGIVVEHGIFQTQMMVRIDNDGPVTVLLDSRKCF